MTDKVSIAIVGLNFGRHILREVSEQSDIFRLAAVCDLDRAKATEEANKLGVPAYFELGDLLREPDIDVIGLFTAPAGRADLIRQIIRAGKDVMTTKPFELDADAAQEVLLEARRLGRVVHLNSPSPLLTDDLRTIVDWRDQYDLGRPVACRAECWANYREKADGSWYDNPALCPAPPIYRLGIYLINDLIELLVAPESVCLMQSRLFTGRPNPDNAQMGILFRNGAIANVFSSFCVNDGQPYRNSLTMNFENGTIYRNVGPLRREDLNKLAVLAKNGAILETAETTEHSGIYQWEHLYRTIRGEDRRDAERNAKYIEQIVNGIKVIDAMKRAQETGGFACLV